MREFVVHSIVYRKRPDTVGHSISIATWLLLLRGILEICGPSTKACARHNFRHMGVGQQYPPVCWTVLQRRHVASTSYTKTQSNNQCQVGCVSGGFCTVLTTRGERYLSKRVVGYRYGEGLLKASGRHTDRQERERLDTGLARDGVPCIRHACLDLPVQE
jgi:hypothetical protein